jgi:beta-lactamase regulating signal transducer with metallopeptidase domain
MATLDSWLSPIVMQALGWALIHALWQGLALAALAAVAMAFSRRPSVRYGIGVGALALMLAAPLATFLVLMKPVPVEGARISMPAVPPMTITVAPAVPGKGVAMALEVPSRLPAPDVLSPGILPWLVGAWLLGVALFSFRLAGGFLLLEHRCRKQSVGLSPRIVVVCRELEQRLGLACAIRYLECGWLDTPAVIGWLSPVVLLPVTALTGLSEDQLRAVIAHELAHIRRLDAFVNLFQILVETVLFYHPAIWWLNRRIRAERELCCDEVAVALTGNRLEYAHMLTMMAQWERAPALAMAANSGSLRERVFHILGRKSRGATQRVLGLTGSVLFLAAALGAANALFGIAYPMPAADAQASVKTVLASSQAAVDRAVHQLVPAGAPAATNTSSDKDMAGGKPAPDQTQAATHPQELVVPSPDLSRLAPMQPLTTPTVLASNDALPPVPPVKGASAGSVQASSSDAADMAAISDSNEPPIIRRCENSSVSSRVISPDEILVPYYFICYGGVNPGGVGLLWGGKALEDCLLTHRGSAYRECPFTPTIKVQFADPADASKMQQGKSVTLVGDIVSFRDPRIVPLTAPGGNTRVQVGYLTMQNARVVDRFGQSTPNQPASMK